MTRVPKPKREVDEKYLAFVRTRPCLVLRDSHLGPIHAHHVSTRGAGGSDRTAVPLCQKHHNEIHAVGVSTAAARWDIRWDVEFKALNYLFGNWELENG